MFSRTQLRCATIAVMAAFIFTPTAAMAATVKHSITISGSMGPGGTVPTSQFKAFDSSLGTLVSISIRLNGTLDYTGSGIPADEGATLGLADPAHLPDLAFDWFPKVGLGQKFSFVKLDITNAAVLTDYTGTGLRNLAVNDVSGNGSDHYTLNGSGTVTYNYVAAPSSSPLSPWVGTVARLKITVAGPITPPPGTPVEAQLGFTDVNGVLIAPLTQVSLLAGQVAWVDLSVNQLVTLRPQVTFPAGSTIASLNATTEIYEASTGIGRVLTTTNSFPPDTVAFNPQGLAGGQILRVVASAYPPTPCAGTLSFTDHNGATVGPSLQVNLSPGKSQVLDLDATVLGLQTGMRAEVQPIVTLQPDTVCSVSAQTIVKATAQTGTYQSIVVGPF